MQTPSPTFQKRSDLHERYPLCWNEWKINYPIFIFWVTADCIFNLRVTPGFSSASPTKKNRSKVVKLTENMWYELKRMKHQFSDFCDFYFLISSKNWLTLSTKSTIIQKIEIEKLIFHSFQLIAHLFCKFYHFWRFFFWLVTHLKIPVSPVIFKISVSP